ncbi:MAG: ATPase, partial [Candidatus Angelobacter sp.]
MASLKYGYALSFAGADRPYAKRLFELLTESELKVFYDENEQSRILAENIEDYLGPIYASAAAFVIPFLGSGYPKRIWTAFKSDQFKSRLGEKAVIPIWLKTASPGIFDANNFVGGIEFDPGGNVEAQLQQIAKLLCT